MRRRNRSKGVIEADDNRDILPNRHSYVFSNAHVQFVHLHPNIITARAAFPGPSFQIRRDFDKSLFHKRHNAAYEVTASV